MKVEEEKNGLKEGKKLHFSHLSRRIGPLKNQFRL